MTIREMLKKIKDDTNANLFEVISSIGYTLKLWDSGNGSEHIVTANPIFTDSEADALEMLLQLKYGSVEVKDDVVDLLGDSHFASNKVRAVCKAIVETYKNHWYRLGRDLLIHYNPSWNVDGTSTMTETWDDYVREFHKSNEQVSDGTNVTEQLENAEYTTEQIDKSTTLTKVYGMDSSVGVNDGYSESDSGKVKTTNDAGKVKVTNNAGKTEEDSSESISGSHITTEIRGGNIGTTMTSQIIRDDINVYEEYTLAKYVVRDVVDFVGGGVWSFD